MSANLSSLARLPDGPEGVRETLRLMSSIIRAGKKDTLIREKALSLIRYLQQKDHVNETAVIFEFVRDQIRYVRDIRGVETLHTADMVMDYGQGDCDDKSILLASLLESIGIPTRLVAVGFSNRPLSHVFVEANLSGKWIALETTEPQPMGWSAPGITSTMILYN